MAAPGDAPRYVVMLNIPHERVEGLHMTLCTVLQSDWTPEVLAETMRLAGAILPLSVGFDGQTFFGRDKDVPVRLMHLNEAGKLALCDAYYRKHFVPRAGEESRVVQEFHVTTKKLTGAEIEDLHEMQLHTMVVKVVGEDTIIWESSHIV
jgi:hypothetical protein